MPDSILVTLAFSVLLGMTGQILASLFKLPAIMFLLVLGMLGGPQGLGLVRPGNLGEGLPVITSCFVAIILFEGGMTLSRSMLYHALAPARLLISVGALVTMVGAAIVARVGMGMPWAQSFIFGSLVIVTGPTVITPILRRVRLETRLAAVLKSEAILIDAVGAITAIVMFEYVVGLEETAGSTILGFARRVGIGGLVGASVAVTASLFWRLPLFNDSDSQDLVQLGALGVALGSYALSESLGSESGIMAATTAGFVLSRLPVPFRAEIENFKERLTVLGVSILFILLSANIEARTLQRVGVREVGVVLALMFLVRPACVFLSTIATGLSTREKLYLSLLAPRGIVAAAMASHFADQLKERDIAYAGDIEALVFLTIAATVCIEGSWAGGLARLLGVGVRQPTGVMIVGVNSWSLVAGKELRGYGRLVRFLDVNPVHCETARSQDFDAIVADGSDPETFERIDLSDIGALLAMTSNDAVNTLACDAGGDWLGDEHTYQILSKPVDGEPRANVRMRGRWAMPTARSHQSICAMLRREEAAIVTTQFEKETVLARDSATTEPIFVPLLVVKGDVAQIATDGVTYGAGVKVIGLAEVKRH